MEIPQAVTQAAKNIGEDDYPLEYLGKYAGQDAWHVVPTDDTLTGFPVVFLYNKDIDEALCVDVFFCFRYYQLTYC